MTQNSPFTQSKRLGRPKSEAATAHEAILDAVQTLLQEKSVRDLTMEAVAKRAGVGKPTLYKWWPSKAALVLALFQERLELQPRPAAGQSFEEEIRSRVRLVITEYQGLLGRITAEIVAEGQSDPTILQEFYNRHVAIRRAEVISAIEHAKARGELRQETHAEVLVDELFGPIYYRLILRITPFDATWGDQLVDQVLDGLRLA